MVVKFDFASANATQLMNEIIHITMVECEAMGDKLLYPDPKKGKKQVIIEVLKEYQANERTLRMYFARLKYLLKKSPPSRKELRKKQREIKQLIKQNALGYFPRSNGKQ